jgi:hypothetical protein
VPSYHHHPTKILLEQRGRFLATWGAFLSRKEAKLEPDYESIKNIYETVTKSSTRRPT